MRWQGKISLGLAFLLGGHVAAHAQTISTAVPVVQPVPTVNDIQNRAQNKYLSGYDQPFLLRLAYTQAHDQIERQISAACHQVANLESSYAHGV